MNDTFALGIAGKSPTPGAYGVTLLLSCYNGGFAPSSPFTNMDHLKSLIREVPDFPKPGINFFDITTLLKDPSGLRAVIDGLCQRFAGEAIQRVVGIEARGFIFAPAVAYALSAGFVPMRKPNKLPAATERVEYALEYGTDAVEVHRDAILPGQRVLIVDDVLATGGTAAAA